MRLEAAYPGNFFGVFYGGGGNSEVAFGVGLLLLACQPLVESFDRFLRFFVCAILIGLLL
jgi:hypothetical protein